MGAGAGVEDTVLNASVLFGDNTDAAAAVSSTIACDCDFDCMSLPLSLLELLDAPRGGRGSLLGDFAGDVKRILPVGFACAALVH
jgi:hypothetical protein